MTLTFENILDVVIAVTGINPISKIRKRDHVDARKIFSYLSYQYIPRISYSIIGKYLKRNHGTIIHHCRSAKNLIETEEEFRDKVVSCISSLQKSHSISEFKSEIISIHISHIEKITGKKVVLIDEVN